MNHWDNLKCDIEDGLTGIQQLIREYPSQDDNGFWMGKRFAYESVLDWMKWYEEGQDEQVLKSDHARS